MNHGTMRYHSKMKNPTFCDTIGTISVVQFGARRLPEIKALYDATTAIATATATATTGSDHSATTPTQGGTIGKEITSAATTTINALQSGGRKLSKIRHLRRRATSYQRYKTQHRFCSSRRSKIKSSSSNNSNTNNRSLRHHDETQRETDAAIYINASSSTTTNSQLPVLPPPPQQQQQQQRRKVRRQNTVQLCQLHETWRQSTTKSTQPQRTKVAGEDDTNTTTTKKKKKNVQWMTTHLYYRKRCHMEAMWNWYVPLLHINRGCAAALRLVTSSTPTHQAYSKCLIQDTTWTMQPIWFRLSQKWNHCMPSESSIRTDTINDNKSIVLQHFETIIQCMIPDFQLITSIEGRNKGTPSTTGITECAGGNMTIAEDKCFIYEPNAFPRHAIGPVTWVYMKDHPIFFHHDHSTTRNLPIGDENNESSDYIYFFVHQSIYDAVVSQFEMIVQRQEHIAIHGPYMGTGTCSLRHDDYESDVVAVGGGDAISCFQLRGSNESCFNSFMKCFSAPKVDRNVTSSGDYVRIDEYPSVLDDTNLKELDQQLLALSHFLTTTQQLQPVITHNAIAMFHLPLQRLSHHQIKQQHTKNDVGTSLRSSLLPTMFTGTIYVQRVCPRDVTMSCNWGVCGYDIYCQPNYSKVLFQTFVLHGGACMIGIVEDAFVTLESCPPMLTFPRDYPDTVEGIKYWNGTSAEWKVIRHYWEGGGGRISKIKQTIEFDEEVVVGGGKTNYSDVSSRRSIIDWENIVPSDDSKSDENSNNQSIIVVRSNAFVDPFQLVLSGCTTGSGSYASRRGSDAAVGNRGEYTTNTIKRKRKHRSSNKLNHHAAIVDAPRLSVSRRNDHFVACQSLLEQLSLPAVLMCSVQLIGAGTLQSGSRIYASMQRCSDTSTAGSSYLLGWVSAGTFSMSRGQCYGIAMIGAKAFIESIIDSMTVRSGGVNGQQQHIVIGKCALTQTKCVQLKVKVANPNRSIIRYEGALSLLR